MNKALRMGLVGLVAATALGAAPAIPAFAGPGSGGGIRAEGPCSGSSTWKVKADFDNGRIEAEFEVDSNVVGQAWQWMLKDNGVAFAKGTAVTQAPSGSFEVRRFTANQAGSDTITGLARNPDTGETCKGSVTL